MRPDPKITPKFVVAVVEEARDIATREAVLRFPSRLGIAIVLACAVLMSWGVIRSTWAQDDPKLDRPHPERTAEKAPTPAPPPVPGSEKPLETTGSPLDSNGVTEASVPKLPDTEVFASSPKLLPATKRQLSDMPPADPAPPPSENDDPEKAAQAFVERNRQVAEGQLKNLKDEAEKLRARLQKVEGGIKRWEALLGALEKSGSAGSSKGLSLIDHRVPAPTGPYSLEPAPAAGADKSDPNSSEDRPPVPVPSKSKSTKR